MKLFSNLPANFNSRLKSTQGRPSLAVLLVVVPICLAFIYLFAIAKDRYVSESTVVVKRSSDIEGAGLNIGLLLGSANPVAHEDAMYLREYIYSADMLQRLDQQLHFKQAFSQAGFDFANRLSTDFTREEFLAYYRKRVEISYDEKSSLLTIRTQGFTPEFALRFNKAVLAESERFINELSHTIAREQMHYAEGELGQAYSQLNNAKEQLLTYQNKNGVLDPQAKAEAASKLIAEMEARLAQMEAEQRNLLSYLNADTPQALSMKNAINALSAQISSEKVKLTSPDGDRLNRKTAQFMEIRSNLEFKAELYKHTLAVVEKIRVESARKLKNLVVITSPQMAEEAEYPRKLHILGTLVMTMLLLYGVARLTLAIIEDHKD